MRTGIDQIEFSGEGRSVTLDREGADRITENLDRLKRRTDLDFDTRIWDRFRDQVNERYAQVAGGTRRAGKVTLSATVAVDSDGIPCVKLTLDDASKRLGTWSSAEGGQLTLEGI